MTRKDYILLADAFIRARCAIENRYPMRRTEPMDGWIKSVTAVCDALGRQNPRFARDHFLAVVRGDKGLNSRP